MADAVGEKTQAFRRSRWRAGQRQPHRDRSWPLPRYRPAPSSARISAGRHRRWSVRSRCRARAQPTAPDEPRGELLRSRRAPACWATIGVSPMSVPTMNTTSGIQTLEPTETAASVVASTWPAMATSTVPMPICASCAPRMGSASRARRPASIRDNRARRETDMATTEPRPEYRRQPRGRHLARSAVRSSIGRMRGRIAGKPGWLNIRRVIGYVVRRRRTDASRPGRSTHAAGLAAGSGYGTMPGEGYDDRPPYAADHGPTRYDAAVASDRLSIAPGVTSPVQSERDSEHPGLRFPGAGQRRGRPVRGLAGGRARSCDPGHRRRAGLGQQLLGPGRHRGGHHRRRHARGPCCRYPCRRSRPLRSRGGRDSGCRRRRRGARSDRGRHAVRHRGRRAPAARSRRRPFASSDPACAGRTDGQGAGRFPDRAHSRLCQRGRGRTRFRVSAAARCARTLCRRLYSSPRHEQ